jgi:hypothetical protein
VNPVAKGLLSPEIIAGSQPEDALSSVDKSKKGGMFLVFRT